MRDFCEIRVVKEGTEDNDEPTYETRRFVLLHFGLKADIVYNDDGVGVAVNYTVAICEDCITGWLKTFEPEEIRKIEREIK